MVLTVKQRQDLHKAIGDYLNSQDDLKSVGESFNTICGLKTNNDENVSGVPLLEKKWTSIVRLQKKVLELEDKVKELENERKQYGANVLTNNADNDGGGGGGFKSGETFLLKTSAKHRFDGHRSQITCVSFHPRYNLLVSGSEDASLKLWDFETGEFEQTLKGHTNVVQDAKFNYDGSLLASCSSDLSIKLWEYSSGKYVCRKTLLGHDHNVSGVAFLKNNTRLVSCSRDQTLKIWDTSSGYCLKTFSGHSDWVRKVAVHDDYVASCSSDHSIIVWNIESPSSEAMITQLKGHEHVVETIAFSSHMADKALLLNNSKQPQQGSLVKKGNENSSNSNSNNKVKGGGLHLVSGSRDKTIKVWHIGSATCLFTLDGHDNWIRGVVFQPHGKYLMTVSEDKTIKTWDVAQQRCVRTISQAHDHFITCIALHPTLGLAATGSVDKQVALWMSSYK